MLRDCPYVYSSSQVSLTDKINLHTFIESFEKARLHGKFLHYFSSFGQYVSLPLVMDNLRLSTRSWTIQDGCSIM